MPIYLFVWNDDIVAHLADNGIELDEFESVVQNPAFTQHSRTTGRPIAFGWTTEGRYIACIYELLDRVTVLPVTAYEVPD